MWKSFAVPPEVLSHPREPFDAKQGFKLPSMLQQYAKPFCQIRFDLQDITFEGCWIG
jgi:hypothetical protein